MLHRSSDMTVTMRIYNNIDENYSNNEIFLLCVLRFFKILYICVCVAVCSLPRNTEEEKKLKKESE